MMKMIQVSKEDTAINLVYSEYCSGALIVRVLDAFGRGTTSSPPPCNCNAPRFGFALDPAFGGLLDGPLTDTALAFCAFAAAVSALFCALAAAIFWAFTCLAFFASSLATFLLLSPSS
jgi:hypothetical protein